MAHALEHLRSQLDGLPIAVYVTVEGSLNSETIHDVEPIVGELRLFKSKEELADLKRACQISAEGHLVAMHVARPGKYEYEVQAEIEKTPYRNGPSRVKMRSAKFTLWSGSLLRSRTFAGHTL